MLQEWRFVARLAAWRNSCASAEPPLRIDVADAFVDRTPIAWSALLTRAQSRRERALIETLCLLDRLRLRASSTATLSAAHRRSFLMMRLVLAIASAQTMCGFAVLAVALMNGRAGAVRPSQMILAAAFSAGAVLLAVAASRDRRALFLLTMFCATASAFVRGAMSTVPDAPPAWAEPLFLGVYPEAFAPAALWEFAAVFPAVPRFTRFDAAARRAVAVTWLIGGVLFAVNTLVAYGTIERGPLRALARNDQGNAFWHLFALTLLPAVAAIALRARRAPSAERRKVFRFAAAIALGTGPFLMLGIMRMASPAVNDWFLTASSLQRLWTDRVIVGALTAMPMLTTIALVSDRPFERQALVLRSIRVRLAGARAVIAIVAPLAPVSLLLYHFRRVAIADIFAVPRAWPLLAGAAIGALVAARSSLREALASLGVVRTASPDETLSAALGRVRTARGKRELAFVLRHELQRGAGAATAHVLVPQGAGDTSAAAFGDPFNPSAHLPSGSVLIAVLRDATVPLDVSADGPFALLIPPCDRKWLTAHGIALMAAVKRRGGAVIAIVGCGPRRDGRAFGRRDVWFVSTLLVGAAAAWESVDGAAIESGGLANRGEETAGDAAFECGHCGAVSDSRRLPCHWDAEVTLAALPRQLAGKFVVSRRLGAGAMGVVYVARDTALGRDVALKTLPRLHDRAAAQLRDEARSMAALNHPSLATIYGVEQWRQTPVLVVEYFPGGTLAQRLARGPLAPPAAAAIGLELARALTYMHERGVLHRDLKPSNIAFTMAGAPKLLDFGLATVMPSPFNRASDHHSDPGAAAGTHGYLPPETYRGQTADPALDLWALSVVLLEAMVSRNVLAGAIGGRRMHRAVQAHLAWACASQPQTLAAFTSFFERALNSDPAVRFQTMGEMQVALETLIAACGDEKTPPRQSSSTCADVR
jgi:hypothetical protein